MHSPRPLRLLAMLMALLLTLVACGDGDGADTASEADAASEPAADDATPDDAAEDDDAGDEDPDADGDGAFPVTIPHKYGETTIPAAPERVVSVGFNDQDDILALGVVPVGIRDWYGDQPSATWPWAQPALGGEEPEVLSSAELDFEAIAALEPDLIIGVSSGMSEEDYALLSAIAPTVAQSEEFVDYGTPWQDRAIRIGQALGQEEEAAAQVGAIEDQLTAIRDSHPEFDGATAAVAFTFDGNPGAYASSDGRARLLEDLGFTTPPAYDEIAGDLFYASFSAEQADLLDTDLLVWVADSPATEQLIRDMPLREGLAAATEGRELCMDTLTAAAFSFGSLLSLPALLDSLVPQVEAAVDGDPATEVPPSTFDGAATADAGADEADGTDAVAPVTFDDPDQADAAAAWALVFDSSSDPADVVAHLEGGEDAVATLEAYGEAGQAVGGIGMHPTAVEVGGDAASITYDVLFGGAPAYRDQTGTLSRVDGVWVVPTTDFCAFMSAARVGC